MKPRMEMLGALVCAVSVQAQTPGFHLVGLAPNTTSGRVTALSQNGAVAAGWNLRSVPAPIIAPGFIWTVAGGRDDFGLAPGVPVQTPTDAISSSGNVVVGGMGTEPSNNLAFRRLSTGSLENLGPLLSYQASHASGVSGDGNTVVGRGETQFTSFGIGQAFRWTPQGGMQPLGFLSPSHQYSEARAISRDGSTIVGISSIDSATSGAAFVWRHGTGMQSLPPLPGSTSAFTTANAANSDGSVIVGSAPTAAGIDHAVRWDGPGVQDLGVVPGWLFSHAFAVSDNGMVVGGALSGAQVPTAFIWTPGTGSITAVDYLNLFGISVPNGWRMEEVFAVSGDGLTFAGQAISTTGVRQGFVATVPAPAGLMVFTSAFVLLRRRRGLT
jgi:probable HAF family extracellular repeat protein